MQFILVSFMLFCSQLVFSNCVWKFVNKPPFYISGVSEQQATEDFGWSKWNHFASTNKSENKSFQDLESSQEVLALPRESLVRLTEEFSSSEKASLQAEDVVQVQVLSAAKRLPGSKLQNLNIAKPGQVGFVPFQSLKHIAGYSFVVTRDSPFLLSPDLEDKILKPIIKWEGARASYQACVKSNGSIVSFAFKDQNGDLHSVDCGDPVFNVLKPVRDNFLDKLVKTLGDGIFSGEWSSHKNIIKLFPYDVPAQLESGEYLTYAPDESFVYYSSRCGSDLNCHEQRKDLMTWLDPKAACIFKSLLAEWKRRGGPMVQVGDISSFVRVKNANNKDIAGHRTHFNLNRFDVRPFKEDGSLGRSIFTKPMSKTNREFMELAQEFGISVEKLHSNHFHFKINLDQINSKNRHCN